MNTANVMRRIAEETNMKELCDSIPDKEPEPWELRALEHAAALEESMRQSMAAACARVPGFAELPDWQQDLVKRMAIAEVVAHYGGFNKNKEKQQ